VDIQIGGEDCRRAYGIDEIALVPGLDAGPQFVDTSWRIGAIEREIPIIARMDGVVDVRMAVLCPSWVP